MKCLVHNCTNHDEEGDGIWFTAFEHSYRVHPMWMCIPCWYAIKYGPDDGDKTRTSQVSLNYRTDRVP